MTKPTTAPRGIAYRSRLAILRDAARVGGLRVVRVAELDRYPELAGSYVMEIKNPTTRHYLPWTRLAHEPATAREKLRALLPSPAALRVLRPHLVAA